MYLVHALIWCVLFCGFRPAHLLGVSAIDVLTDSPTLLSDLMPLHSLRATQQYYSSDIVATSSPLYKRLSDITEHAPETDA